jgi:hypothetical protein
MIRALTAFQEKVLRIVVESPERLIPSSIGYMLIDSKDLVPRRSNPSAQGAALMVVKPLAKLEKLKLIRYDDPEYCQRGYDATAAGRALLAEIDRAEQAHG